MDYQFIRSQIKSGDVLAFSHFGWDNWRAVIGSLIKFVTRSEYTHMGTALVMADRVFVIEAMIGGVRIFPLSRKGDFTWISMDAPWKPETEIAAMSVIGDPYSVLDAIKSVFKQPTLDHGWECAEIAQYLAQMDGFKVPSTPTPAHVVKDLLALGKQAIKITNPSM